MTALSDLRTEFEIKNGVRPGTTSTLIHPPVFRGKNTAKVLCNVPEFPKRNVTLDGAFWTVEPTPQALIKPSSLSEPITALLAPVSRIASWHSSSNWKTSAGVSRTIGSVPDLVVVSS